MALNDISLTAGMRSNLLSLQNTVTLLNRTQSRLSSGKKVSTAIDNPVSFFASQALNSRASVIDSLKDAMGQAVSTLNAADKGITAITAMIQQAKGIAQSAISASGASAVAATVQVTLGTVIAGSVITIGGTAFTASAAAPAGTKMFYIGGSNTEDAIQLAAAINAASLTFTATANGATVSIASTTATTDFTTGSVLKGALATVTTQDIAAVPSELTSLQAQYAVMRTQIDKLAADSGYKGKNLLSSDATQQLLTVQFEGTTLDVQGFDASTTGLLAVHAADNTNAATDWGSGGALGTSHINASITELDNALTTLRTNSSKLAGNLSIITVRQDFTTNMINTLNEGSDKLTLADTNEEGANMLMLQTRQSLSTTALSLSAQAAQSVLRLFQ